MITEFEKELVEVMIDKSFSFSEALSYLFEKNSIDQLNVFDLTDFLEEKLEMNMLKVEHFMNIYTGSGKDFVLV